MVAHAPLPGAVGAPGSPGSRDLGEDLPSSRTVVAVARHSSASPVVHVISMHTSPADRPGIGDAGGMNVYIAETSRALAEAGWRVEVLTLRTRGWPGMQSADRPLEATPRHRVLSPSPGYRVHELFSPAAAGAAKEDLADLTPLFAEAAAAYARRHLPRPDVLHAHYWLSGLAAEQYRQLLEQQQSTTAPARLPLLLTLHTSAAAKNAAAGPAEPPEPLTRVHAEARLVDLAESVITNTEAEKQQLVRLCGADPQRVQVIPPGVDTALFHPASAEDRETPAHRVPAAAETSRPICAEDRPFTVLFAGRPQPLKGPEILIRAAARARREVPGMRVQIHGTASPAYLESLQELARQERLGADCLFRPASTPEDLAVAMRAADAVAMPSSSETFGLVALEAQASGTPVLASDVPGLRAALDEGRAGLLVPERTPEAWAAALVRVARDPLLRTRLIRSGLAHARTLSWSRTAEALISVYQPLHPGG